MPVIEQRVNINRSVTDIFRFMTDFGNNPRWQPSGMKLERVGKVRMGDMIVGHQRMLGRMQFVNADVVDYLPNQRLAYTGVMGGYNFRTTYDFSLAQGGTDVIIRTDIRIPWYLFMFRPFVLGGVRGQISASLERLKQVMEDRLDLSGPRA